MLWPVKNSLFVATLLGDTEDGWVCGVKCNFDLIPMQCDVTVVVCTAVETKTGDMPFIIQGFLGFIKYRMCFLTI